jgi:hypothetical protein
MRHTDFRTLIDRGRRAGLGTADLYNAIAAGRRPEAGDRFAGETDGNGFVPSFDRQQRVVFRPAGRHPPS